jgi:hypothetical protein
MTPSPEERRMDQISAVTGRLDWPEHPGARITARECLDALLAYFDENEPAVADAIRYGVEYRTGGKLIPTDDGRWLSPEVVINYPEGQPKR